jgi:hypothetical protein
MQLEQAAARLINGERTPERKSAERQKYKSNSFHNDDKFSGSLLYTRSRRRATGFCAVVCCTAVPVL